MRAIVTALLFQVCQKLYGTEPAFSYLSESSVKAPWWALRFFHGVWKVLHWVTSEGC